MAGTLQWRTNRRNQSAPCGQSSTHGCSVSRPRHRGRAPHHVAVWLGMLCILASCVQGSSMPTRGQFSLLGVGASASSTEVRKAYRRRARILCVLRGLSRATLGCAWRLAAPATHTCAVAVIRIRTLTIPMQARSFLSLPTRTRQFLSMPRPGTATAVLSMLHVGCVPPNHVAVACREEGRLHSTQPRYRQQQQRYGRQQYSQRYHQQHNQRHGQDHDQRYSHRTLYAERARGCYRVPLRPHRFLVHQCAPHDIHRTRWRSLGLPCSCSRGCYVHVLLRQNQRRRCRAGPSSAGT